MNMKRRLTELRNEQGNLSPTEQETFQKEVNKLEQSIRNFDAEWAIKERKRRKDIRIVREEANTIGEGSEMIEMEESMDGS